MAGLGCCCRVLCVVSHRQALPAGPRSLAQKPARFGLTTAVCCAVPRRAAQVASSRTELMQMLRNMALGVLPDVLRVADSPAPEAHDFLIRGGWQ